MMRIEFVKRTLVLGLCSLTVAGLLLVIASLAEAFVQDYSDTNGSNWRATVFGRAGGYQHIWTDFEAAIAFDSIKTYTDHETISFWAIADTPYNHSAEIALSKFLSAVPRKVAFVVHLGDIKSGKDTSCPASTYKSVSKLLQQSSVPVFITPGDNEYNDCAIPHVAFANWESNFSQFDQNWMHEFNVRYQADRPENFSFVSHGVLFIGINLVGGAIRDAQQWATRSADALAWIQLNFAQFGQQVKGAVVIGHAFPGNGKYNSFQEGFIVVAKNFANPILYLQGDNHQWLIDQPYSEAPNITRIIIEQTGFGQTSDPFLITVSNDLKHPFSYNTQRSQEAKTVLSSLVERKDR